MSDPLTVKKAWTDYATIAAVRRAASLPVLRRFLPDHHGVQGDHWLNIPMNRIDPHLVARTFTPLGLRHFGGDPLLHQVGGWLQASRPGQGIASNAPDGIGIPSPALAAVREDGARPMGIVIARAGIGSAGCALLIGSVMASARRQPPSEQDRLAADS